MTGDLDGAGRGLGGGADATGGGGDRVMPKEEGAGGYRGARFNHLSVSMAQAYTGGSSPPRRMPCLPVCSLLFCALPLPYQRRARSWAGAPECSTAPGIGDRLSRLRRAEITASRSVATARSAPGEITTTASATCPFCRRVSPMSRWRGAIATTSRASATDQWWPGETTTTTSATFSLCRRVSHTSKWRRAGITVLRCAVTAQL